jgi:YD repeat-containing protein
MRGSERMTIALPVSLGWRSLTLTYDTEPRLPPVMADLKLLAGMPNAFGELWLSDAHRSIIVESGNTYARAVRGDGRVMSFVGDGTGGYTAESGVDDRLLSVGGGYRYFDVRGGAIETYDGTGAITRIDRAGGQTVHFSYSNSGTPANIAPAPGYLIGAIDTFGRTVQLEYTLPAGAPPASGGRVSRIVDANGQSISVAYDTAGNLSTLTWQDTRVRQFVYENAVLPWALTGVIDENGARHATITYDSAGRATSAELAGGVDRYSVAYSQPPTLMVTDTYDAAANTVYRVRTWQAPTGVVVTGPYGQTVNLGATVSAKQPRVTTRSQPAGAGCDASSSSIAYDTNGNVAIEDDFNGNRICRAHDMARNLETVRVEGLATSATCSALTAAGASLPSGSRKVSTQWHPDWRVETRRAEPRRITTFVYNGQPDPTNGNAVASCAPSGAQLPDGKPIVVLCKTVEQATTDASGAQGFSATSTGTPRITQATYNEFGQVLTATDARSFTTTYAYYSDTTADHRPGDLQSVTNPAGHVTQYTHYDAAGRLLRMVEANGLVTERTYTPRGWVSTVTTTPTSGSPLATTYTHKPSGQLAQAILPDGTTLSYTYDDAHRLTGVTDGAGNSVTYTLDATGKPIGEQHRDPGGVLARNITRIFDALGRLQSATGAAQ